jgi:hypothetical protein
MNMVRPRRVIHRSLVSRWIDNLAIVLLLASLVLAQLHPYFVWWITLAIAGGRLAFSVIYGIHARRQEAQWRAQFEPAPEEDSPLGDAS